jgi:hypothetical protein
MPDIALIEVDIIFAPLAIIKKISAAEKELLKI